MAAAALVAIADGDASLEEGAEVGRLMRVLNLLRDHEPDTGVERYLHYVSLLRKGGLAVADVRSAVKAAAEDREAGALLIVICHAISEADGVVRESEVVEIQALSELIGVDAQKALDEIAPVTKDQFSNI